MKFLLSTLLGVILVGLVASRAEAQLVNGDFEDGVTGWTVGGVVLTSGFGGCPPSTHPSGPGLILGFPGTGSISQQFECGGGSGACTIVTAFEASSVVPGSTIRVFVDGELLDEQSDVACGVSEVVVDCGTRTLLIEGTNLVNLYLVTASCGPSTATESGSWGNVKELFR